MRERKTHHAVFRLRSRERREILERVFVFRFPVCWRRVLRRGLRLPLARHLAPVQGRTVVHLSHITLETNLYPTNSLLC